jgi:hypothetical protein
LPSISAIRTLSVWWGYASTSVNTRPIQTPQPIQIQKHPKPEPFTPPKVRTNMRYTLVTSKGAEESGLAASPKVLERLAHDDIATARAPEAQCSLAPRFSVGKGVRIRTAESRRDGAEASSKRRKNDRHNAKRDETARTRRLHISPLCPVYPTQTEGDRTKSKCAQKSCETVKTGPAAPIALDAPLAPLHAQTARTRNATLCANSAQPPQK